MFIASWFPFLGWWLFWFTRSRDRQLQMACGAFVLFLLVVISSCYLLFWAMLKFRMIWVIAHSKNHFLDRQLSQYSIGYHWIRCDCSRSTRDSQNWAVLSKRRDNWRKQKILTLLSWSEHTSAALPENSYYEAVHTPFFPSRLLMSSNCLIISIVPHEPMKIARVIPVFKSDDRPVSIYKLPTGHSTR